MRCWSDLLRTRGRHCEHPTREVHIDMKPVALLTLCSLAFSAWATDRTVDPALLEKLAATMSRSVAAPDRFDAEVWLKVSDARLTRYVKDSRERLDILETVYREAHRQQLDPDLVMAVMHVESHFDRFAISSAGAQGIMQVMPFWRLEIGRPQDNLTDVETNIRYGTVILAHYFDVADGDLVEALARYNGSYGRLKYPEKVVTAWRTRWRNKHRSELPELIRACEEHPLRACGHL